MFGELNEMNEDMLAQCLDLNQTIDLNQTLNLNDDQNKRTLHSFGMKSFVPLDISVQEHDGIKDDTLMVDDFDFNFEADLFSDFVDPAFVDDVTCVIEKDFAAERKNDKKQNYKKQSSKQKKKKNKKCPSNRCIRYGPTTACEKKKLKER